MTQSGRISLVILFLIILLCYGGGFASGQKIVLEPHHVGPDYTFTGDYSDGKITITGAGTYDLSGNLVATSTEHAVQIASPDVNFEGNQYAITGPGDGIGVHVLKEAYNCTVQNITRISNFSQGVYAYADNMIISDVLVQNNTWSGIASYGNNSLIYRNTALYHGDSGVFSWGHNSIIYDNVALFNRNGILSQGNYADVSGNMALFNSRNGIVGGGVYVGPEPGDWGHGYYARIYNNVAMANSNEGIYNWLPHAVIEDNTVIYNTVTGIRTSSISNNTSVRTNHISLNPIGINMNDRAEDVRVYGNLLTSNSESDIFIDTGNRKGSGSIYDNYFSSPVPVTGTGDVGLYSWTNPSGPVPGENIVGGPYVAGNYWSSPNRTGWSDISENERYKAYAYIHQVPAGTGFTDRDAPHNKGYTTIPFEVVRESGVFDTAPLVSSGESEYGSQICEKISEFSMNESNPDEIIEKITGISLDSMNIQSSMIYMPVHQVSLNESGGYIAETTGNPF
ncbi:MAG: hypothetical protein GXY48_09150 [Methanomicrobiales archaeon]|nr:hypothetical protein [Methanomicrobiales archaeon]